MLESLKSKLRIVKSEDDPSNAPSPLLDLIDGSTVVSMKIIQNEGPVQHNQQVWSLRAQKAKLESERDALVSQRNERAMHLMKLKRERTSAE
jgi:hypothetical protein